VCLGPEGEGETWRPASAPDLAHRALSRRVVPPICELIVRVQAQFRCINDYTSRPSSFMNWYSYCIDHLLAVPAKRSWLGFAVKR